MIVIGFKYFEAPDKTDETPWTYESYQARVREVVVVGQGDRRHVDHVVVLCPIQWRAMLAQYLAPLLEGKEPQHGCYGDCIMWWKRCEVLA